MRIIYLSADMSRYSAAFYQQDVMDALQTQHHVFFYGPGFPLYDSSDAISDVISKSPFGEPNLICVGHAWLTDSPQADVDRHPKINLSRLSVPKVMIINKEYTNLDGKLDYIVDNNIDMVFTHHHDIQYYEEKTRTKFVFWPFAVDPDKFRDFGLDKAYDLVFTGLLRNPTIPEQQSDVRVRVQKRLFYSLGELRLLQRPKYRRYKFFWHAYPASNWAARVSLVIHDDKRLPPSQYSRLLNASRVCFNALSPLDLVTTRYYESMAAKCLCLCPRSPVYKGLFEDRRQCVMFESDLSDFDEKLFYYLDHEDERQAIVEEAYRHVRDNHTWGKRIEQFTAAVQPLLRGH